MRTTKLSNNTHELNFIEYYELDVSGVTQRVKTSGFSDISTNEYTDIWNCAYNCLKSKLDNDGLTYVNS